jgi:hypothetical protein
MLMNFTGRLPSRTKPSYIQKLNRAIPQSVSRHALAQQQSLPGPEIRLSVLMRMVVPIVMSIKLG